LNLGSFSFGRCVKMEFDMVYSENVALLSDSVEKKKSRASLYSVEEKKRNILCGKLLNVIQESVMTFKPSKSMHELSLLPGDAYPQIEIDVVISGGGLKGYFMAGCSHVLKNELAKQNVKIARIAGASAGAWSAFFMLVDLSTEDWLESYYLSQERAHLTMHEVYEDIWPWMCERLPEDAYQKLSGRLFISITELTLFGMKNHMISEFESNMDLFECLLASSTVPFISLPTAMRKFRGMWVIDGGATNNTPVFPDNVRRQLVFRLTDVFYPTKLLLNPTDRCIESLVVRGAMLMAKFLQGEPSDSFAWLEKKKTLVHVAYDRALSSPTEYPTLREGQVEEPLTPRSYKNLTIMSLIVASGSLYALHNENQLMQEFVRGYAGFLLSKFF